MNQDQLLLLHRCVAVESVKPDFLSNGHRPVQLGGRISSRFKVIQKLAFNCVLSASCGIQGWSLAFNLHDLAFDEVSGCAWIRNTYRNLNHDNIGFVVVGEDWHFESKSITLSNREPLNNNQLPEHLNNFFVTVRLDCT